jgi:hypothetical protein
LSNNGAIEIAEIFAKLQTASNDQPIRYPLYCKTILKITIIFMRNENTPQITQQQMMLRELSSTSAAYPSKSKLPKVIQKHIASEAKRNRTKANVDAPFSHESKRNLTFSTCLLCELEVAES